MSIDLESMRSLTLAYGGRIGLVPRDTSLRFGVSWQAQHRVNVINGKWVDGCVVLRLKSDRYARQYDGPPAIRLLPLARLVSGTFARINKSRTGSDVDNISLYLK